MKYRLYLYFNNKKTLKAKKTKNPAALGIFLPRPIFSYQKYYLFSPSEHQKIGRKC
jgi:hypothetical protein